MSRNTPLRRTAAVLLSALVVQAGGLPYFSGVALADDVPRVVLLPVAQGAGSPDRAQERFRELMQGELKSRDSLSMLDLPKGRIAAKASKASDKPSADAVEALEQGQKELEDLKFDAAVKALKNGIELMTARPEAIDYDTLVEGWMSLAVASFRMGDEDGAQKALLSVVRVAPEYRLPDGKYPPIFVREFEKARRRSEKAVRGSLSVDGPPGSTAFVDGKDLGMVPVLQDNLAAGTHYVKVEGTRGELFGEAVEVKTGTARVKAKFGGASGGGGGAIAAIGPVLDHDAVKSAHDAAQSLGADFAVVAVLYRSGDHQLTAATAVYSVRHKGFAPLDTYAFDDELLTANVEAYKLADDISDLVEQFQRPASLPINLAEKASYVASESKRGREDMEIALVDPKRRALTQQKPKLVPEERVEREEREDPDRIRALDQESVDAELADSRKTVDDGQVKGGPAWWVWAVVGVGVAAAAGGTYYGVSQATRPVTGTVTASW